PEVASDERRRIQRLPPAACEAEGHDCPERVQHPEALPEDLTADWIENHVRPHLLGEPVIRERLVRALLERDGALLVRARRRQDSSSQVLRELDRGRPNAAGPGVHEHHAALPHADLPRQGGPGGQERQEKAGSLLERRSFRQSDDQPLVDRNRLRVAAAARQRHHPPPVALASNLPPGHRRQSRGPGSQPCPTRTAAKLPPAARTRTKTSPSRASGSGTSASASWPGPPVSRRAIALTKRPEPALPRTAP